MPHRFRYHWITSWSGRSVRLVTMALNFHVWARPFESVWLHVGTGTLRASSNNSSCPTGWRTAMKEYAALRVAPLLLGAKLTSTYCCLPAASPCLLTFHGKGVVRRAQDLREATAKAAQQSKTKLSARLSKGKKRNRKPMATVGAVYTVKPQARTGGEIIGGLRTVRSARSSADRQKRPRRE